jgi:hypothetical protein
MFEDAKIGESETLCPVCGESGLNIFYSVINAPASCNRLWKSKDAAINCPKGDIKLAFCPNCTFISNIAIESSKNQYDNQYDNSLFYSAHFQEFAKKLALTLIKRFNLHMKNIVEIGGGKAVFLSLLIDLGPNRGTRINPFNSNATANDQKTTDVFDSYRLPFQFAEKNIEVDFVFSYHELEHMNNPKTFLENLRQALAEKPSARIFFSVPNSIKDFNKGEYSDIIYEHVSYFTIPALIFLFSSCGFYISRIEESEGEIFDSIYVDAIIKRAGASDNGSISEADKINIEKRIRQFADKTNKNVTQLSKQLTKLLDAENRVVIWGAGARGVTFLNIFKDRRVEYAVDINPHKQGMFVPGTGQLIVKPEFLKDYKPDFVLIANPSYKDEIRRILDNLEVKPNLICI